MAFFEDDDDYFQSSAMGHSDSYYDSDGSYDAAAHMMGDPVDFQMYGHGGFGYDTSHIQKDDPTPDIVQAAEKGDFNMLVEECFEEGENEDSFVRKDPSFLNASRRWTEVDYKMSGFTKEYEWHGLTALATAALNGHAKIVEFLLQQEADPTLEGRPSEDPSQDNEYNALSAAIAGKTTWEDSLQNVSLYNFEKAPPLSMVRLIDMKGKDPNQTATFLLERRDEFAQCVALLQAASPFWTKTLHASSHFSQERAEKGYPNQPSDSDKLKAALKAAGQAKTSATKEEVASLTEQIEKILQFKKDKSEASQKGKKGRGGGVQKKNAGRGGGQKKQTGRGAGQKKNARHGGWHETHAEHAGGQKKNDGGGSGGQKMNVDASPFTFGGGIGGQTQHDGGAGGGKLKKIPAQCRFFAKGRCRYGDDCRFSHEQPHA
jgi:hypothetical protein